MDGTNKLPDSAKEYFDTLPKSIQEQIMQSGVMINTRQDLENIYRNISMH